MVSTILENKSILMKIVSTHLREEKKRLINWKYGEYTLGGKT